jgi:Glycosyltransferase family 9 (heptosyltransferase)
VAAVLKRKDRFAVFWGGGLGDALVIRPLIIALEHALEYRPCYFTTATHLNGVFDALGLKVDMHILPTAPLDALAVFRRLGIRFDWLYLGPHPRIKTRMLAHIVGAEHIWSVRHLDAPPFLGEQVLADVRALGISGDPRTQSPYGGGWGPDSAQMGDGYLLLHPGAKSRWQTKQWPEERWIDLMGQLLGMSSRRILLVGTPLEAPMLEAMRAAMAESKRGRVFIRADLSLEELAASVAASRGVICHNSGVMHVAAMLGKPTLALTGSSPHFWRPPYPHVLNLDSGRCNLACDQYRCPVPFYRARCIRELSVPDVMDAIAKMNMLE